MLHPKSLAELSYTTVGLMEDIWHKRRYLRDHAYFVFRLEASNFDSEKNDTIFVHYLVTEDRWYSLVSEDQFDIKVDQLKKQPTDDEAEPYFVHSWRHYAFGDVVTDHIQEALLEKIGKKNIEKIDQFTIWNTFPAESIDA